MPWKLSHQSSVDKGKGFWNLLDLFLRACSNVDGGVLVHLGSLSKEPWTEGHINNRNFLLTVLEAGRGQSPGSGRWVVWWGPIPWFLDSYLCCIFTWWKGEGSLTRAHTLFMRALPSWPSNITLGIRFQHEFWRGTQAFKLQQRGLLVLKWNQGKYINSQPINSHRRPCKSPRALDVNLNWRLSDKTLLRKRCVEWRTGLLKPRYPGSENTGRRDGREISLPLLLNF